MTNMGNQFGSAVNNLTCKIDSLEE